MTLNSSIILIFHQTNWMLFDEQKLLHTKEYLVTSAQRTHPSLAYVWDRKTLLWLFTGLNPMGQRLLESFRAHIHLFVQKIFLRVSQVPNPGYSQLCLSPWAVVWGLGVRNSESAGKTQGTMDMGQRPLVGHWSLPLPSCPSGWEIWNAYPTLWRRGGESFLKCVCFSFNL